MLLCYAGCNKYQMVTRVKSGAIREGIQRCLVPVHVSLHYGFHPLVLGAVVVDMHSHG